MKLIIDIPEEIYKPFMDTYYSEWVSDFINSKMYLMIRNGTPIPDNATVGEVFCMLACKEPICETASYYTIDKNLWNSPYQKGGK